LLAAAASSGEKFDFDAPYNRFGTDSVKWDAQVRRYGKDSIVAGMGVSDTDFRTAPAITKALAARLKHENWGYLDMPQSFLEAIIGWNKRRYGIDIHLDRRPSQHCERAAGVLAFWKQGAAAHAGVRRVLRGHRGGGVQAGRVSTETGGRPVPDRS
jgi:hypothetical protein